MSVLALPFAIAGVLAALVPVAIHLLWRQRRRPVPWGAMRFVQQAWRRHRRRHRLEQWLLLASRALVLLLFGLALARPVFERGGGAATGGRDLWLVIDDSVTSGVRTTGDDGTVTTALERSVLAARQALDEAGPGSRASVITMARPATTALRPPTADLDAVRRLLDELEPRSVPADPAGAILELNRSLDAGDDRRPATVRLLGELRRGTADLDVPLPRIEVPEDRSVVLLADAPATSTPTNVTVADVVPARPIEVGGEALGGGRVTVRLERTGDLPTVRTTVRLDGRFARPVPPAVVDWRSGQAEANATFAVEFEAGLDAAVEVVARVAEDALPAGDARATVVEVRTGLDVLLIDRTSLVDAGVDRLGVSTWIERALRPVTDAPIDVRSVDPASLERVDLGRADAVLVLRPDLLADDRWALLVDHVADGGLLVLVPPADLPVQRWTDEIARFGLDWTVRQEVRDEPAGLSLDPDAPAPGLLAAIASELPDLVRPVVAQRRLFIEPSADARTSVLSFVDGTPLLAIATPRAPSVAARSDAGAGPTGRTAESDAGGLVVLLAVAPRLDWTNLPGKPLMVPLMQEIVRQGAGLVRTPGGVPSGERPRIARPRSTDRLVAPDGRIVLLGSDRRPDEALEAPGTWTLLDAGDRQVGRLAVHVESSATRTDPNAREPVRTWLTASGPWTIAGDAPEGELAANPSASGDGGTLARVLLAAVLLLLALETFMARRFSHAGPTESSGGAGIAGTAVRFGRRPSVRPTIGEGSDSVRAIPGGGA